MGWSRKKSYFQASFRAFEALIFSCKGHFLLNWFLDLVFLVLGYKFSAAGAKMIRIGFFSPRRQVQGPHSVLAYSAAPEEIIWLLLSRQQYTPSLPARFSTRS